MKNKPYSGDINDLVDQREDMNKGGVGSGIKGHETHHDDSKKLSQALGRPADVFKGKNGYVISTAVLARNWNANALKSRIPKELQAKYDVKINERIANGQKVFHIDLTEKSKIDTDPALKDLNVSLKEAQNQYANSKSESDRDKAAKRIHEVKTKIDYISGKGRYSSKPNSANNYGAVKYDAPTGMKKSEIEPNLIYKSEKPYTEDLNDIIEKGGVGSGKKGHTTNKNGLPTHRANPKADAERRALADSYIEKFKMKHPDGMSKPEMESWFRGAGLDQGGVVYCMDQILHNSK